MNIRKTQLNFQCGACWLARYPAVCVFRCYALLCVGFLLYVLIVRTYNTADALTERSDIKPIRTYFVPLSLLGTCHKLVLELPAMRILFYFSLSFNSPRPL